LNRKAGFGSACKQKKFAVFVRLSERFDFSAVSLIRCLTSISAIFFEKGFENDATSNLLKRKPVSRACYFFCCDLGDARDISG